MKKTDIWMPIFIGNYLSETMHLTTEQHGAYLLILMAYWKNQGALSEERLQGIVKLSDNSWTIDKIILMDFFDTKKIPGKWFHAQLEKELLKSKKNKEAAVIRGKRGMEKRWGNKNNDEF